MLRWNPPHNAWTCDRCRSVFPNGAVQGAPQVTPSQPYPAAASAPAPGGPSPWAPPQGGAQAASAQAKTVFGVGAAAAAAQPPVAPAQPAPRPNSPTPPPVAYVPQMQAPQMAPRPHTPTPPPPAAAPPGGGPIAYAPQHPVAETPPPFGVPPQGSGPHMYAPPPGSPYAPGAGAPMPYSPHPTAPPGPPLPYPPPGRRSNTGLIIGISVGALAVIGIIIGVVVAAGGGKGYGAGSKDDLMKDTLASLAAGDLDKMMKLAAPEHLTEAFLDCDKSSKGGANYGRGEKDDDEERQRTRKQFQEAIDLAKGLTLVYIDVSEAKEPKKMSKGEHVGPEGCKLKYDVISHRAEVKVKVSKGDKPAREQKADVRFVEVDGRWILDRAPKLSFGPDCAGAVQHMIMQGRDELRRTNITDTAISKLEDKLVTLCTDDSWSEEAVRCFAEAPSDRDTSRCMTKLTSAQRDGMTRAMVETMSGSGGGPTVDPSGLPVPCQDYKRAFEEALACDKLSATRDSLAKGLEEMLKLAASYPTASRSDQERIERLCRDGTEPMRQMVRSVCP